MRIRKLSGRDFRRYRTFDIELAPGLTVIRGPNEAGKTTIQRALELALTRRVTSTAAELEALRPWGAPTDARSIITIDFEQDEEDGQQLGTLEKTFAGAKGTVKLDYDGQSITDPALADQVMAELTGIPTEGFFRSTASVHHFELSDLSRDEGALRDRLQASISGADRGTSRARKKLDKALHDLNTRGDRNPGRLKVAEQAVEQSQAALDQGELALAQLERDRDALSGARDRRADAETALAERRSLLEKARQAERITAERDAASERYERYRQAVEVDTRSRSSPTPIRRRTRCRSCGPRSSGSRTLDGRIRELRAALSGEVEVDFEVAPEPTWRPLSRLSVALVVIGLIIVAGPVVLKVLGIVDLGRHRPGRSARSSRSSAWSSRASRCGSGGATSCRPQMRDVEIDRRLRGRSEMEAELRTPRPRPRRSSARSG